MIPLIGPDLAAYVDAHTTAESPLLARLRAETQASLAAPQMQVGHVEGALLRILVAISRARDVLEIGTYSGYSGLAMASALPDDGKLVTCDIDPVATAVARRYFAESGHGHKIDLRLAPALDTIAELAAEGRRFDLVFIDADKHNYVNYWNAALPLVPVGGLVVADNTLWSGKVVAPKDDKDRAIVAFNSHVAADPRVEHVLLSVRDGIMLARKLRD
ncbi:caffeoyl-CoA O-methyltransferase [Nannocystis exedens]|uniref:Caffeoyl-CoA O-methyltransferase n=1 Tax=Nannocystis exedens TaxID=54 RepID=A0A1I2BML1_9BACT|nr:class I SAM-dependent methyltransferase [Nannocystis exedens]PCC67931.1 O-methyltransferase [Nannocystis exedens]SFE56523.1 caffeoyl-CoA O-methyltransferase [Nannocystis exedens]